MLQYKNSFLTQADACAYVRIYIETCPIDVLICSRGIKCIDLSEIDARDSGIVRMYALL